MKVLLSGGGSLGSVSPLLAIYDELKKKDPNWQAIWIGTKDGPEKEVVEKSGIKFLPISSGRYRRFFTLSNLWAPFKILVGFFQARKIIKDFQPDLVLTAGSFVAYPVARAAKSRKIPVFIHQQDVVKGLANKLMEKYASVITITFDQSLADFDYKKTYFTSNPARIDLLQCSPEKAVEKFNLDPDKPTILITGGGTGAAALNQLTLEALGELTKKAQVVHLTGRGKSITHLIPDYYPREVQLQIEANYRPVEFVNEGMCELLKLADVVVSRAGISTLTELSLLHKAAVIIPIPESHQVENAKYFAKFNACRYLPQEDLEAEYFAKTILDLLENRAERENLEKNIAQMISPRAAKNYVDLIYKFLQL